MFAFAMEKRLEVRVTQYLVAVFVILENMKHIWYNEAKSKKHKLPPYGRRWKENVYGVE